MCFTVQLSRFLSCDSHIRLSHLFWLVKNFFHFLENFYFQEFQKLLRAPLSPTAMLEYHSISPLSTAFVKFFWFFFNFPGKPKKRRIPYSFLCMNPPLFPFSFRFSMSSLIEASQTSYISFKFFCYKKTGRIALAPACLLFFIAALIKNLPADYFHTSNWSRNFLLPCSLRFVPRKYPRTKTEPEKWSRPQRFPEWLLKQLLLPC